MAKPRTRKKTRGPLGAGSVFLRRGDGRWVAQLFIGYGPTGKPRYKSVYKASEKEAVDALKRLITDQGCGRDPVKTTTLSRFLDDWMRLEVEGHRAPQTIRNYKFHINGHLKPALGRTTLEKLTPAKVQTALNEAMKSGLSPSTVVAMRNVLRNSLNTAMRWGLVHVNAASRARAPKLDQADPVFLNATEATALLKAAKGHQFEGVIKFLLYTGVRCGEVCGLTWGDVDLAACTCTLKTQLQYVKGKPTLVPLKTKCSQRGIPLVGAALEAVKDAQAWQMIAKSSLPQPFNEQRLVFLNQVGRPVGNAYLNTSLMELCEAAGIRRVSAHKLRHTFASISLGSGVSPFLVQQTLGHRSVALTTSIYGHAIEDSQRGAMTVLDDALKARDGN